MNKNVASKVSTWAAVAALCSLAPGLAQAGSVSTATTTVFGPNVYVFDTSMPAAAIQAKATSIFKQMESNQFGTERYALLFKPGTYNVLFDVGFYTQVAGLGQSPDDVLINGGVNVPAYWMPNMNATCNFWRTYENFSINASSATNSTTTIAVSQAAPLRRMHIKSSGGLWLFQVDPSTGAGGWASGGFMADSVVDGQVLPGSQQQWFSRNSKWGSWGNAVWNMVFLGDINAPSQDGFPTNAYTTVDRTPVIREKPYLYVTSAGQYAVFVPALQTNTQGPSWLNGATPGTSISIDQFYIAQPSTASAASINSALSAGKHILFTPGIYKLNDSLKVTKADTIILGLGDPSLIPTSGTSAITVADVDGVKLAGLIIDAGPVNSASLVEVGPTGSSASHSSNPTFLYDLTVRTAGPTAGKNDVGIKINSHNVVGDQLWLWRADHGDGAEWNTNPTKSGLVVNGNNVTMYGLFNEHHEQYQTLWNGNGGRTYFYQSEIPYDPPNQASYMNGSANGWASYKVANNVTSHEAWGLGIYSYFRDSATKLENAIEVPNVTGVKLHHMTTIWLNGVAGSEITHIINGTGGRVYSNSPESAMRQTMNEFAGTGTPVSDTQAPSTPGSLAASAASASQINLTWAASSDNVGVSGYLIFRGGTQVGSSSSNSYSDTGLSASTTYSYTVKARDAAGNTSAASSSVSATTQASSGTGGTGSEWTYGWVNNSSTQATLWFKPTGFTANYVVAHYYYSGMGQQNVNMTYNSSTGRWELPVSGLSSGKAITYWYTYNKAGAQYDSATYTWTKP